MKRPKLGWKTVRRAVVIGLGLALFLLVFVSGRFVYLSRERFPLLSHFQPDPQPGGNVDRVKPQIIGHRGSAREWLTSDNERRRIGNTRTAIAAATDYADWIEIDVRKALGGELVVFHDRDLADKTDAVGNPTVESLSIEGLKSLNLPVMDSSGQPEKILTLDEVLDEFHDSSRRWILDIKSTGIASQVLDVLAERQMAADDVILFGDHAILEEIRQDDRSRGRQLGYTTLFDTHRQMLYSHDRVLQRCQGNAYSILAVPVVFVTPALAQRCAASGICLWVYDTNHLGDLDYCVHCGVSGLIVDFPRDVSVHFGTRAAGDQARP